MPAPSLIKPTGQGSGPTNTPHLVFLALGLVAFAVLWALPVVVLVWLSGMGFGSVGIAEMLERTRGLAPTTYGGAFWLSVAITVTMVALEVRALVRGAPEHRSWLLRFITRPSTAYWVLIGPTLLLVRIDTRGTDVPDILTTTLLLCCLGYVWFVLPLGVASVAWRLTWWMWRKGSASGFGSGLLGTLGLSFAVCTPVVCVVNDEPPKPVAKVTKVLGHGFDRARGQDAIDGSRTFMSAIAEEVEPQAKTTSEAASTPSTEAELTDAKLFDDCVKELLRGGESSLRNRKISVFVNRYYLDRGNAEDIVQEAVLELCLRHARIGREPYANVAAVFNMKADSRRLRWHQRQRVRDQCAVGLAGAYVGPQDLPAAESAAFDRAYCSLDEVEREILERDVLGQDSAEIGALLGLKPATVRQRKHRAIEKVLRLLQLH